MGYDMQEINDLVNRFCETFWDNIRVIDFRWVTLLSCERLRWQFIYLV